MEFQELEAVRQKYAKKLKIFLATGLIIFAIAMILAMGTMIFTGGDFPSGFNALPATISFFFLAILTAVVAAIVTHSDAIAYKKLYKTYFVERVLNSFFTGLYYEHQQGMPKSVLASTGMINTGDVYKSNDFTSGKYKDVAFSQADVEIQEEHTDSDGNTSYDTIFKGRWMVFDFPKPFTFRLQIVQKWFGASKKLRKDARTMHKIERIHTESIDFDKKFKIYAEDGFEAYYILDPAFISHIEDLSNAHKGKLLLCFIDNRLHVGINDYSDAFEPPNPLRKIDEATELAKIHHDIKTITDFVDYLKLDHKLFSTKKQA